MWSLIFESCSDRGKNGDFFPQGWRSTGPTISVHRLRRRLALNCKSLADLSERSTMIPFNSWITGALIPQPVATPAESFFWWDVRRKIVHTRSICFLGMVEVDEGQFIGCDGVSALIY